ncbi:hypothetical protein Rsub_11290 [Raphidocelis subcapitata]|uniref:Tubby C-terminal domain-containing protein n=1 Tax=Raphidocelis subcapitata TaxID=307507 RepID=A0A2V0PFZ0_9CHLO|nr:hypothetical protein Rsub_11290 [Raphidocelis subcapitata]|eukprot:GBF98741.1 hypothetical protein Rsub_11290 [Raphidocelis subcapitata]
MSSYRRLRVGESPRAGDAPQPTWGAAAPSTAVAATPAPPPPQSFDGTAAQPPTTASPRPHPPPVTLSVASPLPLAAPASPAAARAPLSPLGGAGGGGLADRAFTPTPPPVPHTWTPPRSAGRMRAEEALQAEIAEMGRGGAFQSASPLAARPGGAGSPRPPPAAGAGGEAAPPLPASAARNNLLEAAAGGAAAGGGGAGTGGVVAGALGAVQKLRERLGTPGSGSGGLLGSAASSHGSSASLTGIEPFASPGGGDSRGAPGDGAGAAVVATRRIGGDGAAGGSRPASAGGGSGRASPAPPPGAAPRPAPPPRLGGGLSPAQWQAEAERLAASGCGVQAALLPGPVGGAARCFVRRVRGPLPGPARGFELRVEASDRLLLSARRRSKNKCSSFLVAARALDRPEASPLDADAVAKVKANLAGSEYVAWLKGGPAAARKGFGAQALAMRQLPTSDSATGGARGMVVAVPAPGEGPWLPLGSAGDAPDALGPLLEAAQRRELSPTMERRLVLLRNAAPFFDAARGVHYLDFRGRATKRSPKNFQLCHWDHNTGGSGAEVVLLFGKRGGGEYALDFGWPLNAAQAFALALSTFDTKLFYAL